MHGAEYGIQDNFKKYKAGVYEMPPAWIERYKDKIDLVKDYKGKINNEKVMVSIFAEEQFSDLQPWPPEPDYSKYFSNCVYLDAQLMYEDSVENALWTEILSNGPLQEQIKDMFNMIYLTQISGFNHSNEGFWITLKKATHGLRLDSLGAGMRIGFKLIMALSIFKNTAILIEEFDAYEHPESLRNIIKTIYQACKNQNLQFFITTHRMESIRSFLEFYKEVEYQELKVRIITTSLNEGGLLQAKSLPFDQADDLFYGGIDLRNLEDYG